MHARLNEFLGKTAVFRSADGDLAVEIVGVGPPDYDLSRWFEFFQVSQFLVRSLETCSAMAIGTRILVEGKDLFSLDGAPVNPDEAAPQVVGPKGE